MYQRALSISPSDVPTLRLLAKFKWHVRKSYSQAADLFSEALSVDPNSIITLKDYADLKVSQGDDEEALALYRRILREDPSNPLAEREVQRLKVLIIRKMLASKYKHIDKDQIEAATPCMAQDVFQYGRKVGLEPLFKEWGNVQTQTTQLNPTTAQAWIDKCLLKLDEILTKAEKSSAAGDSESENMFRQGFAILLNLFYATEKCVNNGVFPSEVPLYEIQRVDQVPSDKFKQLQHDTKQRMVAASELSAFLATRAQTAESKMAEDIDKGISIDRSIGLNFPCRPSSTPTKVFLCFPCSVMHQVLYPVAQPTNH